MNATTTSRTFEGALVPSAGTYTIDAAHSHVGFSVRHLMIARVTGQFRSVTGSVIIGEDPLDSTVEVSIDTATIDTRDEQRDGHLRSPDFLDVEEHPAMTFTSGSVRSSGAGHFEIDGLLTIKDVTQPLTVKARLEGIAVDPWGNERAGFSAVAEVDREAWGLMWNQPLDTGGVLVGRKVMLEIEAEIART